MRYIGLFFFILYFNIPAAAQFSLSKAERLYQKAGQFLISNKYQQAENYYLKSIAAEPLNPKYYYSLAKLYEDLNEFEKAANTYEDGMRRCLTCKDAFLLDFVRNLLKSGQFQKAEQVLFSWRKPKLSKANELVYNHLKNSIHFAKSSLNVDYPNPENLGSRINSEHDDYFPFIRQNDSVIIFTRRTNGIDEDIYGAHRDSCGGWFQSRVFDLPYSSSEHEGALIISSDQHYMFFMRCGNRTYNFLTGGGCDIYFSYTKGKEWSSPSLMGATINTPYYEGTPSLSSDNSALYFSSDRPGGYGGKDIWVSYFKDGFWQIPENLGPEVNSAGDELNPWIAADQETLYFSSDGHPGFGGQDIFFSKKTNGKWSKVQNLGKVTNSPYDDISFVLSPDGQRGYFSSNRPGGLGGFDIYEAHLPKNIQAQETSFIYGVIRDSLTKKNITYALLEFTDLGHAANKYTYKSNKGDGSYLSALELNKTYSLNVYRPGYMQFNDTLLLENKSIFPPDTIHISLLPDGYQPELKDSLLFRYYFPKNDALVADSIKIEILKLVEPFRDMDFSMVHINGYTDDSGTPIINEELSFGRAQIIKDLLLENNFSEQQIMTQGWADANPIAENDSEENRAKNRRVEILISIPK